MKKFLSILLIILMIFCLVSCNDEPEPEPEPENTFDDYLSIYARKVPDKADTSSYDPNLCAPAQGGADNYYGLYGYCAVSGDWYILPYPSYTGSFSEGIGAYTNDYNFYQFAGKDTVVRLSTFDGESIIEDSHSQEGILVIKTDGNTLQPYAILSTETMWYAFDPLTAVPYVAARIYNRSYRFAVATKFNNGKAVVMRMKNSDITDACDPEKAYVIDKTGKVLAILPSGYDIAEYPIDENNVIIVTGSNGLYGLCSATDGSILIAPQYKFLRHCQGELYLFCNNEGMWGYINKKGEVVIEPIYYKASNFSEGIAAVYNGEAWGYINEKGETVIDFIFDNVGMLEQGDIDESLDEGPCKESLLAIEKSGFWAIIDTEMNVIISIDKKDLEGIDSCPYSSMNNNVIVFRKNVKGTVLYGAFNYKGELLFDAKYLSLGLFN